jgi:hypothetical protein
MSPSLEDDQVPTFWFCPHCVNNNFHIAVDSIVATTPTTKAADNQPLQTNLSRRAPTNASAVPAADQYPTPHTPNPHMLPAPVKGQLSNGDSNETTRQPEQPCLIENRTAASDSVQSTKRGRSKHGQSPPKKKSKYSVFSAEVDKALAVIHSELELAAEGSRSEDHLNSKIDSLEQQLRLQNGQMALLRQELDMAKRDLDIERFRVGRLETICQRPNDEVTRLTHLLAQKDEELNNCLQCLDFD